MTTTTTLVLYENEVRTACAVAAAHEQACADFKKIDPKFSSKESLHIVMQGKYGLLAGVILAGRPKCSLSDVTVRQGWRGWYQYGDFVQRDNRRLMICITTTASRTQPLPLQVMWWKEKTSQANGLGNLHQYPAHEERVYAHFNILEANEIKKMASNCQYIAPRITLKFVGFRTSTDLLLDTQGNITVTHDQRRVLQTNKADPLFQNFLRYIYGDNLPVMPALPQPPTLPTVASQSTASQGNSQENALASHELSADNCDDTDVPDKPKTKEDTRIFKSLAQGRSAMAPPTITDNNDDADVVAGSESADVEEDVQHTAKKQRK